MKYEAYLYRYTHRPTGRMYVGIHKGLISDGYNHSSTCEEFNRLLRESYDDFDYEVLLTGSYGAMQNEEYRMLSETNAKSNVMFFNKSNGSPSSKNFNMERVLTLAADIKNMTGEQEMASEVGKVKFIQVRAEDDWTHKQNIQNAIDEEHGNTEKLKLQAVLLEGYYEEGDDEYGLDGSAGIGGNHSTRATNDSKHGVTLEVIRVPLSMWEGMTDSEVEYLGMMLNVQEGKIQPKVNQSEDFSKIAQSLYYNHNIDLDSDAMILALEKFNITKRQINSAINKAKKSIEKYELSLVGKKLINWTRGAQKKHLEEDIIPSFNKDGKTYVEVITSGSGGSIQTFMSNFYRAQQEFAYEGAVCLVRHPNISDYESWIGGPKNIADREMLEFFMEKAGIEFKEVGLKLLQDQKEQLVVG